MRAAFKAVMAGRQVAVLVPTTVLAQQHVESFSDRMAGYPVRIETLSRFAAPAERRRTLAGMEDGSVDIVIGTHALLQPSVRFKRLGLVIIDEEQRFGVRHKERFKQVRRLVDVLTMTATPIPRTLYMSMTGARDMSLIRTPPEERMAIETIVAKNTDDIVRKAILRELNREGQAFYLHNRILTIERAAGRIARLAPEARILVAHGRMAADELSDAMHRFVAREFDVLVCTTIIESGVDIPNANTILIDRADRFGIAELYQLRGRVGRSNHKAYAYFLLPESGRIESDARQRIAALKRHSGLGAGFSLALRDLEIRGAGNLLGARQSGHIAAVGFDLYCQLLRRSIARLKGEPAPPLAEAELALDFIGLSPSDPRAPGAASIPYDYVEDEALRVGLYGRLARATETAEAAALREELRDRFGPPPPSVNRLIDVALLRIESARRGLRRVEVRHGVVRLWRDREPVMPGGRFPRLTEAAPDAMLDELRGLVSRL
jgi:transcription-repair coupling factor (superfamily II helicase)